MSVPTFHEEAVFHAARRIAAPAEREEYLRKACGGDETALRRLLALLAVHTEDANFLQPPADLFQTAEVPPAAETTPFDGTGAVIAEKYTLQKKLGEGGMGEVWIAQQSTPVKRQVALKLIKAGADFKSVLQRFEQERQALALLDHPHITKVFDGGMFFLPGQQGWVGWGGSPYFVMELVPGQTLTQFCDAAKLTTAQRLELFILICQAIQHAHQKGIIHRDLKPANILVSMVDSRPVPKVIDFGIAKAVDQKLTEATLHTAYGLIMGTPAYMSPEQTEPGQDVDTRSDIYALGVILYELLTGTTPLDVTRLHQAGYAELQRLIREEETPRPSTRLSALGEAATVVAGNRGTDVKRLRQLLASDLDWIVLKALEKDRNRRYESASSFAADLDRYLRHEPILARPPSTAYQVRKFVRRHRVGVFTGLAITAALLSGLGLAIWQALVATAAKEDAQAAASAEKQAKELAQTREAETRAVLEFVEDRIFAAARPEGLEGGLGRTVTLRKAVEAALPYVEKSFADRPLIEARLRQTLGASFFYLGEAKTGAVQYEAARRLYAQHLGPEHPQTVCCMTGVANCLAEQGRHREALALREGAVRLFTATLGPDHAETLVAMSNLAVSYSELGRHAEALAVRENTLARQMATLGPDHVQTLHSRHNLGLSYRALNRHDDACKVFQETLRLFQTKLGAEHPSTLQVMGNLGNTYDNLGRDAEALALRQKLLALHQAKLGPTHHDTLRSMSNLAMSHFKLGHLAASQQLLEATLPLHKRHLGPDHPQTLRVMANLSVLYANLGRLDDALQLRREALVLRRAKLGPTHPDSLDSMWGLAEMLLHLGRGDEALPVIDEFIQHAPGTVAAPRLMPVMLDLRLHYFRQKKDAAGCRHTAELWEKLGRTDADSLYTAARMRSLAATWSTEPLARADADRAMVWLRQSVAAGFHDREKWQNDPDLAVLRKRADFRQLLQERDARPKK